MCTLSLCVATHTFSKRYKPRHELPEQDRTPLLTHTLVSMLTQTYTHIQPHIFASMVTHTCSHSYPFSRIHGPGTCEHTYFHSMTWPPHILPALKEPSFYLPLTHTLYVCTQRRLPFTLPYPSAPGILEPELGNLHLKVVLRRVSGLLLLSSGIIAIPVT